MLDSSDQGPRKQAVVPPSPVSTPIYIQHLPPFTGKHTYTDTEAQTQTQTQPIHIHSRMPFLALTFLCPTDKGTHRHTDTNTDKYRLTIQWIDIYVYKNIQSNNDAFLALLLPSPCYPDALISLPGSSNTFGVQLLLAPLLSSSLGSKLCRRLLKNERNVLTSFVLDVLPLYKIRLRRFSGGLL